MTAGAVGSQRYPTGGDVVDAMRTGVGVTSLAVARGHRIHQWARRRIDQAKIRGAGMTGCTRIMLQVVGCIGEDRIINRGAMAVLTCGRQRHTVGRIMVNVMGEQVQGRIVVNVAMTLGTIASHPAVLQRAVSVMTDRTGVVLQVIATIYKGLTRGNRGAMASRAVSNERHVTCAGMIDGVIIPGPANMTGRTDRTAAGAWSGVGNERQIRGAGMTG